LISYPADARAVAFANDAPFSFSTTRQPGGPPRQPLLLRVEARLNHPHDLLLLLHQPFAKHAG
jgi:hypothetical protein